MGEWERECLDCGWRGMVADLSEETDDTDDTGDRSFASCPECGGAEFKKQADSDEDENA
jgi:predicted  nucleic acid-binding Zn-ribbon protein